MRTESEQETGARDRLRQIADQVRTLQAQAKAEGERTLAYLLEMAAIEAEARARQDPWTGALNKKS